MVGRAEQAAVDVQAFIAIFFETFKEFKGRKLHLAGESYGGRYLPVFAAAVYDGNKALVAAGSAPINLKSVMIGYVSLFCRSPSPRDRQASSTIS